MRTGDDEDDDGNEDGDDEDGDGDSGDDKNDGEDCNAQPKQLLP